jgi:UDP-2-acetamido-2,6-beta-L-arabino-hexul-4-ose reductase
MKIIVTGAEGFIGKNVLVHLQFKGFQEIVTIGKIDDKKSITSKLQGAGCVIHLAGANRPTDPKDFETVNYALTSFIVDTLEALGRPYRLIYTSSAHAGADTPYGQSKLKAEKYIESNIRNGLAFIYRLPGVFGKWCRPNYNSVVATFCNNIARDLSVSVSDVNNVVRIVYIDDVVRDFVNCIEQPLEDIKVYRPEVSPVYEVKLGELLKLIKQFKESRTSLILPDLGDGFTKKLYTTWLSYLPENDFSYGLDLKTDNRGWLFELLKTKGAGQIFISKTIPGITRGNHFHHTKTEKFVVLQGEGLIRFRKITEAGGDVIEYRVTGNQPEVVDIPPGYTHNITNVGDGEMLTLFWANEIFDASNPDTYYLNV